MRNLLIKYLWSQIIKLPLEIIENIFDALGNKHIIIFLIINGNNQIPKTS